MDLRDILASAETILTNSNVYFEQDTIERVIVPTLRLVFGEDFDAVERKSLIRGNRRHRGCDQLPDLWVDLGNEKTCAIECKSCYVRFECSESSSKEQSCWTPFSMYETKDRCRCSAAFSGDSDQIEKLAKHLGVSIESGELKLYRELWNRFDFTLESYNTFTDVEKRCLAKLVAYQSNQTTDILGQLWRYACDGNHRFDCNTKLVWTNGLKWVVFCRSFYNLLAWPNVPFASTGEIQPCEHFEIVEMVREDGCDNEARFKQGVDRLKQLFVWRT